MLAYSTVIIVFLPFCLAENPIQPSMPGKLVFFFTDLIPLLHLTQYRDSRIFFDLYSAQLFTLHYCSRHQKKQIQ